MTKTKSANKQIKLYIAADLWDLLLNELAFLGVGCRLVQIEERELKSRNDFLRLVVEQYCDRLPSSNRTPYEHDDETHETTFYLDAHSKGRWSTAISDGAANSFSQLVNSALFDYFNRQVVLGQKTQEHLLLLKEKLQNPDLRELREMAAL